MLVPVRVTPRRPSRPGPAGPRRLRAPRRDGRPLLTDAGGRVVALDYGRRRIGVAVTDPTGTIASPGGVIEIERGKGRTAILPPAALLARLDEIRPSRVVVGIPLDMDGSAGEMAREVRAFAAELAERTGLEIVEWDERLTTARAEREIAALGLRRSRRREKGRKDEMAATLMLTDYLRSTS